MSLIHQIALSRAKKYINDNPRPSALLLLALLLLPILPSLLTFLTLLVLP